ncbi:MAG: formylmethanofuran dehydrogenase subunit B [Planctomycetaceae bacterium]
MPTSTQQLTNMICPGCGCVCDDVRLSVQPDGSVEFGSDCFLGEAWFQQHARTASQQAEAAMCHWKGASVLLEEAVSAAADLLKTADYPLIYGLSRSVTGGQRAAVALAEALHGVVDSTASLCHGPSIMALQETGEVTSTLGEVRNRADLVIFWGCNPADSHPRHASRYSVTARGRFTKNGRADRTVVMIGDPDLVDHWSLDAAGTLPDVVIRLPADQNFETLSILRASLNGTQREPLSEDLQKLLDLIRGCRYGVIFFGLGLARTAMWTHFNHAADHRRSETGHNDVMALLKFVADANRVTRMTARRMRLQGDVSGADNVLLWQTGYPFGVDFSRGYPRYNPGEFTARQLLERGDVDACLMIGAETIPYLGDAAGERLKSIPTILLDHPGAALHFPNPTIHIRTAVHGVEAPGTIYRMDNVPLTLRPFRSTTLPTDEFVLNEILVACEA